MYQGPVTIFKRYWRSYGGFKEILCSLYFHISLILLVITFNFWSKGGWWDQPITIVPSLLGFSLGGLAMFLGFGNEQFRSILSKKDEDQEFSVFVQAASTFVHFMVLQLISLLLAIICKSLDFYWSWPYPISQITPSITKAFHAISYLIFIYAVVSALAAVFAIFRIATWFEASENRK